MLKLLAPVLAVAVISFTASAALAQETADTPVSRQVMAQPIHEDTQDDDAATGMTGTDGMAESEMPAADGNDAGLIETCRAHMVNDRATLKCVEDALAGAESNYQIAAAGAQQNAAGIDDVDAQRNAVKALASSAMAFEAYRESECRRQQSLIGDQFAANLAWLACKARMFDARAELLSQ